VKLENLNPDDTYTVKLTIADGGDRLFDTAVFVSSLEVPTHIIVNGGSEITTECDNIPVPSVTSSGFCGDPTISFSEERIDGECPYTYTLIRTWTGSDSCGNTATATQTLHIQDTEWPVLYGYPVEPIEGVQCDSLPTPPEVTAEDNCDTSPLEVQFSQHIISDPDGTACEIITLQRSWDAYDSCGNHGSNAQRVHAETLPPVLSGVPDDVTLECDDSVPNPPEVTAPNPCAPFISELIPSFEVSYSETRTEGSCPNTYTLTRTWTTTDYCGRSDSKTQIIQVLDTNGPVFNGVPSDITVQCASNVPTPADVTATDCGSDIPVFMTETITIGSCANRFTNQRTWTATDSCGNTASVSQIITVNDNTPPTITNLLQDVCIYPAKSENFWCASPSQIWSVSDNCEGEVIRSFKNCSSVKKCDSVEPGDENDHGDDEDDASKRCKIINDKICFKGEKDRCYSVFETFTDQCGNTAVSNLSVKVRSQNRVPPCVTTNYSPNGRGSVEH